LVRRDVFTAGGNAEVATSQLTSVSAGLEYSNENYKRAGYTDSDTFTVPLDFFYKITPKVDLSGGYQYRDTQVQFGQNSVDHYINVGARGDFTPKLTGRFTVGWTIRDLADGTNNDTIGLDASFSYELSPKTSLQLGASNDFGTSPQAQQQKNFTVNAGLTSRFNDRWSLNASASYRNIEYTTHTDDYWEGTVGVSYAFNSSVSATGSYTYRNYKSPFPTSEFTNNVFSLSANFRY
jgi:hypothetical protein